MPREQIAPTKSNLIRVKERLATATEGYDLLEQKREILVMEIMHKIEQVKLLEKELDEKISKAYPAMRRMLIVAGMEKAGKLSENISYSFDIREQRVFAAGMNLPSLEVQLPQLELKYSPAASFAEVDETAALFFDVLKVATELASIRTIAWRLARELRKTQRRVNALEKMVIPEARETMKYIDSALEEKDRDAFFSSKLLKRRLQSQ
ncbi:MAG: V-type ATP synthase subunit D [Spirochaetaceae bacterium]|jgi:V/A-type H+-transporting ATPase subunit D|nr:V-type ATP synthase subunit D [Spirochaetaceae bacterium]